MRETKRWETPGETENEERKGGKMESMGEEEEEKKAMRTGQARMELIGEGGAESAESSGVTRRLTFGPALIGPPLPVALTVCLPRYR